MMMRRNERGGRGDGDDIGRLEGRERGYPKISLGEIRE